MGLPFASEAGLAAGFQEAEVSPWLPEFVVHLPGLHSDRSVGYLQPARRKIDHEWRHGSSPVEWGAIEEPVRLRYNPLLAPNANPQAATKKI